MTRQGHSDNQQSHAQQFILPDTRICLWPQWLEPDHATALLAQLQHQLPWSQDSIRMFGKAVKIPRTQVWMGDAHCQYSYSGTCFLPQPWHPQVQALAQQLSRFLEQPFNCVLLNFYAGGEQHMGWHADNEAELGHDPVIASISLGVSRRFELKHRQQNWQLKLDLSHGSLLLMDQGCQLNWLHRLPKQSLVKLPRLNLTFRYIKNPL